MPKRMELVAIGDAEIEIERHGSGKPLLLLPGEEMLEGESALVAALAKAFEVAILSPPGFGGSSRPDWITTPDDIAYLYLSLIEKLALDDLPVIGCSLGGWIAAELATKNDTRLSRLVLVDPYGIKPGGPTDRDIADIWQLSPQRVAALRWRDPAKGTLDAAGMSDAALARRLRDAESFARFCWEPYMHNPKLKHRLSRIGVPTLLVWGEADGVVAPAYGEAYRALIPDAALRVIPAAGHYPHLERPEAFLDAIAAFLGLPELDAGKGGAA